MSMTQQQRESTAKYLYDFSKGVGLIAIVGGLVGGQATATSAIVGSIGMIILFLTAYWLEGRGN